VGRFWQRFAQRSAPAGCIPLAPIDGKRIVVLCLYRPGAPRIVEGGKPQGNCPMSEAIAEAPC
jgi:hypothetical protein